MVIWIAAFVSLAIFYYVNKVTKRNREQKKDRRLDRHLYFMEQLRNAGSGDVNENAETNTTNDY
jgi:hypothetical protein